MDYSLLLGIHFRDKADEDNGENGNSDPLEKLDSLDTGIDLTTMDPALKDHLLIAQKSMAISSLASQNSDLSHAGGGERLESLVR